MYKYPQSNHHSTNWMTKFKEELLIIFFHFLNIILNFHMTDIQAKSSKFRNTKNITMSVRKRFFIWCEHLHWHEEIAVTSSPVNVDHVNLRST